MIIITRNKTYKWDYKRLIENIKKISIRVAIALFFIVGYLLVSTMDYKTLIGR